MVKHNSQVVFYLYIDMVLFTDFDLSESVDKLDQKVQHVKDLATNTNSNVKGKLLLILCFLFSKQYQNLRSYIVTVKILYCYVVLFLVIIILNSVEILSWNLQILTEAISRFLHHLLSFKIGKGLKVFVLRPWLVESLVIVQGVHHQSFDQ